MEATLDLKLFCPMFAMFMWTFVMFVRMALMRFRAVFSGQVSARYFELFKGEAPEYLHKAANNVNNLMQVPNLFYIVCMFITFAHLTDQAFVNLAWIYVCLRIAHSCIHISYNKVLHRFAAFFSSNIVLMVIWVRLAMKVS